MGKKLILSLAVAVGLAFTGATMAQALTADEAKVLLGKEIFFDKISSPDSMACADCHGPIAGWTGPNPGTNRDGAVYRGAVPTRFGNRKPPSAAYATPSPNFHYDEEQGLFIGGNFWDGRATGEVNGSPAADQALGPFLNPVEQNNPDERAVLKQIAESKYAYLWPIAWPDNTSINYALNDSEDAVIEDYKCVGLSIAAYEASSEVNAFNSKYDYYLANLVELTAQEEEGRVLFNGAAMCAACHPSEDPGPNGEPPLFTDFTFDNLGVPKNPLNPVYQMNPDWIDPGLAGFLLTRTEWVGMADANLGKHKVPTLRNVALAPGNGFIKAYMHNGAFTSLKEVVHFYNTRDTLGKCNETLNPDPGVNCWPAPEVGDNINEDELGDLGLTDAQEDAIVAFMMTLSDGYELPKK